MACGTASGRLETRPCGNEPDGEHFQHLTAFQVLKRPLSASEMKRVTGQGFSFRNTMFSVSDECREKLLEEIRKHYL